MSITPKRSTRKSKIVPNIEAQILIEADGTVVITDLYEELVEIFRIIGGHEKNEKGQGETLGFHRLSFF